MTDERDPLERMLDLTVYAPIGLALSFRDLLPKLVEKGRQQLVSQSTAARFIGELAVKQGTKRAQRLLEPFERQAEQVLAQWGLRPAADRDTNSAPPDGGDGNGARGRQPGQWREEPIPRSAPAAGSSAGAAPAGSASAPADLPIPGYDTLSASQVVQRLAGLSAEELEKVRVYEQAGRARKTVLTRLSQLKSA